MVRKIVNDELISEAAIAKCLVEKIWGSRKCASDTLLSSPYIRIVKKNCHFKWGSSSCFDQSGMGSYFLEISVDQRESSNLSQSLERNLRKNLLKESASCYFSSSKIFTQTLYENFAEMITDSSSRKVLRQPGSSSKSSSSKISEFDLWRKLESIVRIRLVEKATLSQEDAHFTHSMSELSGLPHAIVPDTVPRASDSSLLR